MSGTHLIACRAARLLCLGMMAATVEIAIALKVYQVDQQLLAHAAHKAAGMPAQLGAQSLCEDHNVTAGELLLALQAERTREMVRIGINNRYMLEFFLLLFLARR